MNGDGAMVALPGGTPGIIIGGIPRALSVIPRPQGMMLCAPNWSAMGMPLIPERDWVVSESDYIFRKLARKNQRDKGSCTGFGSSGGLESARALAGMDYVNLSGSFPYAFNNRGRDQGAITSEVVGWIAENGTCPDSMCPWDKIFPSQIQNLAEAQRVAKRYRVGERYAVQNWQEIGSALTCGFVVIISLHVSRGWSRVDSEGMPPADRGVANHAIYLRRLVRYRSDPGKTKGEMPNSWGNDWAEDGIAYVCADHFLNSQMGDHIAIKTATIDPEDSDLPSWP